MLSVMASQHHGIFRLLFLQNHHWNTIRSRCLVGIKISYDLLQSYGRLCSLGEVLERKAGRDIPKSPRLGF